MKYQYKNHFIENNFINLGKFSEINYILIKKDINDSSLILYIEANSYLYLDLYKYKIDEITSDHNEMIKEPKAFYIDYYIFNNLKSFGIQSNQSYYFYEQKINKEITISNKEYTNISIIKHSYIDSQIFRKLFIFFNVHNSTLFEVKKFNYTIFHTSNNNDYYQLCQGVDTKNEIYFYFNNDKSRKIVYDIL